MTFAAAAILLSASSFGSRLFAEAASPSAAFNPDVTIARRA